MKRMKAVFFADEEALVLFRFLKETKNLNELFDRFWKLIIFFIVMPV